MDQSRRRMKVAVIITSLVAAAWGCYAGFAYWFHHGALIHEPLVSFVRKHVPGFMLAHHGDPVSKHIMSESVWAAFIWGAFCFLVVLIAGLLLSRIYQGGVQDKPTENPADPADG
ncbi:MAG: hypothetical protein K9K66_16485 [Desulfarculaceae bacterium]|nr:hypothetical protein [Desulfarculaceae bacterium]MCF8074153.1 hypothetical protein [Desulfarculaceae bacterium]MCF8103255.1 hypothetical protein [Desulfarculaceae bacterium]MCF8116887.1 hypothetical protein [Desulfarculaceae bacterium]